MSGEELLEEFAAKEPEDVQEEWLARFSVVASGTPDMAALVDKQIADDQLAQRWPTDQPRNIGAVH